MTNKARKTCLQRLRLQHAAVLKHAKAIATEINKILTECQHTETEQQADPSGGHDHAYTCLICGKEW